MFVHTTIPSLRRCALVSLSLATATPLVLAILLTCFFFFFNDTATTEIYTLSLHDALPISWPGIWNGSLRKQDPRRSATDRKSTRLNSSHGSISYAVFCLKKKNITIHAAPTVHDCLGSERPAATHQR